MKPPPNTARATWDTTEALALGRACVCTARYETPTKSEIAIVPRTASVIAAFRPCGRRNALTPFAIASTPVSAVEPDEKARSRTNSVIVPVPTGSACGVTARPWWKKPTTTSSAIDVTNRYVGAAKRRPDSRTPRRFASTIRTRHASERPTLCEASDGTNDVIAKMPAEIETATVKT
jgi:hypothetical protein